MINLTFEYSKMLIFFIVLLYITMSHIFNIFRSLFSEVVGEEKSRNGKNTFLYHRATEALKQIYLEHNLNEPKRKIAKFGIILSP